MQNEFPTSRREHLLAAFNRYVALGAFGFLAGVGITIALHEIFSITEEIAYGVALTFIFFMNFALARTYVYRSKGQLYSQAFRFVVASFTFRLGEFFLFLILHSAFNFNYVVAIIIVTTASFTTKFFVYGKFVFNGKPETSSG